MKRNRLNTTLVICTIAFIICLTGCKDIAGSSVAPETDMPIQSSSYLSDDSNNAIDYNQYIRKSWVMKSWNKGAYDGYCSFCIYKISNDKLEGKFYTNAISKFDDQESFMNLIGTINNDIAECMVSDEDV